MFSTLNVKNFIIAGHEHSTRDSCGPLNYNRSGTISQGGKLKPTLCSLCR